ncbi:restriction endonuclease subunit S [Microcoleus vaginatus DQ-U2]|uniref:restriction endonuclease subunit S n=1 Tax=Microcoleus vaginatus TaxID=119532 RepID=UPI001684363B|nr:restriction endonuclease subunit S [Microcoleus sp. FACHB-DQ6]
MNIEIPEGYKQTEIGVIPGDWDTKQLEALGSRTIPAIKAGPFGSSLTKDIYVAVGYKIYGQEQVIRGDYLYGDYFISAQKFKELESCAVQPGDILLSLVGTTGKLLVIPENAPPGIINPRLIRLSFDKQCVEPYFFKALFESKAIQNILSRNAQGGTMSVLNATILRSVKISLPPLPEQKTIAQALSDADAAIAQLDRLITKKRNIKQGTMQQLLTGKRRLAGFSGEWKVKRQKEVVKYINGRAYKKSEWEQRGIPVVRLQNLTGTGEEFYYSNLKLPDHQYIDYGDLIFMWSASFGPFIWKGGKAIYHYHIWKIECDESEVVQQFYYYKLIELTEGLKNSSNGSTMLHVTKGNMEQYQLTFPPLTEQKAIAQILTDMDTEIEALEQKRNKYKAIKQGMMQELLTGRTRLI